MAPENTLSRITKAFIKASGMKTKEVAMVLKLTQITRGMKATGKMIRNREMEGIFIRTRTITREIGKTTRRMEMVSCTT